MARSRFFAIFAAVALFLAGGLTGCGDDDGSSGGDASSSSGGDASSSDGDASSSGGDASSSGGDASSSGGDTSEYQCAEAPVLAGDCDGDGIPDSIEIATGTQFDNPDSDGDTICDGANSVEGTCEGGEDLNNNGQVDPDEFDPRLVDTDMDGVPDNMEPQWLVCRDSVYSSITALDATLAETVLALPQGYSVTSHSGVSAVSFSNPTAGVFGYVVSQETTSSVGAAHLQNQALIGAVNKRTNEIATRFTTSHEVQEGRPDSNNGLRTKGSFSYGVGEPNETPTTKDPAVLRDEIISALTEQAVSTGETSDACARVINYHVTEIRDNGALISVGVLVCEDGFNDAAQIFEELLTTTTYAPGRPGLVYVPEIKNCDSFSASADGGFVDFLWVIDNSFSMVDEQANVADTTQLFLSRLRASGVDWRLGVTTTDSYCLDIDLATEPNYADCWARMNNDPMLEQCTGLRGPGFVSEDTENVEAVFQQLITENSNCTVDSGFINSSLPQEEIDRSVGKNVCGFGIESGLSSTETVIDRLNTADKTGLCDTPPVAPEMGDDPYALREGASVFVVWVSDEEDQEMKASAFSSTILPPDDSGRITKTTAFGDLFTTAEVRAYAIVGDAGSANGAGVCQELISGQVEGAEHGLGYVDVAQLTGGSDASICNTDLSVPIDTIITEALGLVNSYELEDLPIASSIRIATAGLGIIPNGNAPEILNDPTTTAPYWLYNSDTNSVVFFNLSLTLKPGEEVVISYRSWQRQAG